MTTTLITGANKGLGFEAARRLTGLGHTVLLGARDPQRGREAAVALGARFVQVDVADDASVAAAAADVTEHEGRLDVLVNNAAIPGSYAPAQKITGPDAADVYTTNVAGIIRMTHAFLPLLRRSPSPVIVNVTSGVGSFARTQDPERTEGRGALAMPIYASSKAAVNMLTAQYARALPDVRINAADPGFTATDFNGHHGTQTLAEGTDAIVELATIGPDGPTGVLRDRFGAVEW